MRKSVLLGVALLGLIGTITPVCAEDLHLSGVNHWLAVASTKDIDTAIGIARSMANVDDGARVVSSQSGYYAVILGPYAAESIPALKKANSNIPDLPKDALLSRGDKYVATVWHTASATSLWTSYEEQKPAKLSFNKYIFEAHLDKVSDENFTTTVSGGLEGAKDFTFTVGKEGDFSPTPAAIALLKLDPNADVPQLLFTRFSGGAHCCTKTWIVNKPNQSPAWSLIEAETLDGDGYWFEDVDGDGAQELLKADNRFFYSFDSYAGSFAPVIISKLQGGAVVEVTESPAMRPRLKQDLAGLEYAAKVSPELWKQNGFLVAWVASKIRLGEGDTAWPKVVENIDLKSDFGPQQCSSGESLDKCPTDNLKPVPILKGLAGFLNENNYLPLPKAAEKLLN